MNFKNILGAAAIAAIGFLGTVTASNAAVGAIKDTGSVFPGDFAAASIGQDALNPLVLDPSAVDTSNVFDTTASRFTFLGGGTSNETFFLTTAEPVIFSVGNLVTGDDFDQALVTVNGVVLDLKANPDTIISIATAGAFTIVTDIIGATGKSGSFDFTVGTVPLPAGLALLLGGLGILGWVGRRRQTAAA